MAKHSKKDKKKRKNKKTLDIYDLSDVSDEEGQIIRAGSLNASQEATKEAVGEGEPAASGSKESKKSKKEKKQQKQLADKLKGESKADEGGGVEEPDEQCLKCKICEAEFETRNKLFEHIEAEGHAAPVQPLSYNQIKKMRIAQAKLEKEKEKGKRSAKK